MFVGRAQEKGGTRKLLDCWTLADWDETDFSFFVKYDNFFEISLRRFGDKSGYLPLKMPGSGIRKQSIITMYGRVQTQ